MAYLEDREEKIKKLHEVYSENVPEYIKEILDVPELSRINGIDINAGINLSGFNIYKYNYSILDHSLRSSTYIK